MAIDAIKTISIVMIVTNIFRYSPILGWKICFLNIRYIWTKNICISHALMMVNAETSHCTNQVDFELDSKESKRML